MQPRILIIVLGIVAIIIGGMAVVSGPSDPERPYYDPSKLPDPDDPLAGTTPTEGNDESFQTPTVNNTAYGKVILAHHEDGVVTFKAVPNEGYTLQCWQDSSGDILGTDLTLTLKMSEVGRITAVFGTYSNKVIELNWQCPVFTSDGIGSYTDESFAIAIPGEDYIDSLDAVRDRNATPTVKTPASLLSDDMVVTSITSYLEGFTEGMPDLKKAIVIMTFVQDTIAYVTDTENYGTVEFWATPLETVYSGKGDCEDTATLFVNIASRMGLDVGFVTFDYVDNGHMSAAVKLTGGASVSGGTTFVMDGSTYAYVETASDVHVPLGYLSPTYNIADGKFTPITYSDGVYTAGTTKTIGIQSPVESASPVNYGDVSEPPVLEMHVGDSFSYTAETNMRSEITAEGSGMAFLTFDGDTDTLYGTADRVGTYTVLLTAVWSVGSLSQTAYQLVTFHVTDADGNDSPQNYSYADGVWTTEPPTVPETEDVPQAEDDDSDDIRVIIVVVVIALIGAVAIGRTL